MLESIYSYKNRNCNYDYFTMVYKLKKITLPFHNYKCKFLHFKYFISAPTQHHSDVSSGPDAYFFDIDAQQVRARYDPRQLSANIGGIPSSTSNEDATSCQTADGRYAHGQKVNM